jgi:mannose-6-phosphate isomerase-like protein (cupin superfamily)
MEKVSIKAKLASFDETWVPKIIGELNGQYVKVAKLRGEYIWHAHEHEDELFLVIDGEMDLHFRHGTFTLGAGEFCIVPRGVEHKPEAKELCQILLFEPATTRNTGAVDHAYTIEPDQLEKI